MSCDLSARIIPGDAKCMAYIKSHSASCRDCDVRPGVHIVGGEDMGSSRGTCKACGRENLTLPGRGMCGKCYTAERQAEPGYVAPPSKRADYPGKVVGVPAVSDVPSNRLCTIPGCTKWRKVGLYCTAHSKDLRVDVPEAFGEVVNAVGNSATFVTDAVVVMALRDAWQAKESELLVSLSGLSPLATLARAAAMVEQIKGIGC